MACPGEGVALKGVCLGEKGGWVGEWRCVELEREDWWQETIQLQRGALSELMREAHTEGGVASCPFATPHRVECPAAAAASCCVGVTKTNTAHNVE